jgi:hypothetical protein
MRRLFWLAAMLAATAVAAPAALAAPPTLTGETLTSCTGSVVGCQPGDGTMTSTLSCPALSPFIPAAGSFTFSTTGIAAGPYPGTFTEQGKVTVADLVAGDQLVLSFEASFTIDSPAGQVRGTKRLTASEAGFCFDAPPLWLALAFVQASYEARITTTAGTYRDEGATHVVVEHGYLNPPSPSFSIFNEDFTSSLTETVPALPATKDECKNGGWQTFGVFKNQGECVSFVANGGKKPPTP